MAFDILDVTKIAPPLKHATIFQHFDMLAAGDAFILQNDHDPKPVYYELLDKNGNIFDWEYLEQGPQRWSIQISRKGVLRKPIMEDEPMPPEETIGGLAAKDPRKVEIFKKFGLQYGYEGAKTLKEACKDAEVLFSAVHRALNMLEKNRTPIEPAHNYDNWELDFLINYIVKFHHQYVEDQVETLTDLSARVAAHHGPVHPELYQVREHVNALLEELQRHQTKEEKVLFPFIKEMVNSKKKEGSFKPPALGSIVDSISLILEDHRFFVSHLQDIARLTTNYKIPEDACGSLNLYYQKLKELEEDMQQHLHLENNILYPKAVKLEKELNH